jgi:alanine-synthesizing transaminase
MFSRRLPASLAANRIARALDAARAAGRPLYDLTESNPTVVGLAYPEAELRAALADGAARALAYHPTPRGLDGARASIAADYARRGAAPLDAAHVWLTASTSEAYAHLFKLLCDPGERVLVPAPSYPLFELLAGLEAVECAPYPIRWHGGWYVDVDAVAAALDARTRAILIVHPNNPTGSFVKRDELAALDALAAARGLALVSDEVFADYARAPHRDDATRAGTLAQAGASLHFALGGLSKLAGLPQLKLGWIAVSGPDALVAEAETRLEHILDTFLSVNQPVQEAAPALLALAPAITARIAARVERNRAALTAALRGTAADVLDAEGGWYAIVRVPRVATDEEWVLALLDDGVIVQPGFFYDFDDDGVLVVSLLAREDVLDAGAARLAARVARMLV